MALAAIASISEFHLRKREDEYFAYRNVGEVSLASCHACFIGEIIIDGDLLLKLENHISIRHLQYTDGMPFHTRTMSLSIRHSLVEDNAAQPSVSYIDTRNVFYNFVTTSI